MFISSIVAADVRSPTEKSNLRNLISTSRHAESEQAGTSRSAPKLSQSRRATAAPQQCAWDCTSSRFQKGVGNLLRQPLDGWAASASRADHGKRLQQPRDGFGRLHDHWDDPSLELR